MAAKQASARSARQTQTQHREQRAKASSKSPQPNTTRQQNDLSPDNGDARADLPLFPGLVRRIYRRFQGKPERQTSPVTQRQAKWAGLRDQIAHKPGVLRGEGNGFMNGAQCRFPGIVRAEAPADKLALNFGQIDAA